MNDRQRSGAQPASGLATAGLWLRGALAIASDIYGGTVNIVEGVHRAVSDTTAPINPAAIAERPIRRLVYRQVRDIGALSFAMARAGAGVSGRFAPWTASARPHDVSLHAQSALNAVCGDYLAASGNELALSMRFIDDTGDMLDMASAETLADRLPAARPQLALLVHGLGMNDRQWRSRRGRDIGDRLRADFDCTVLRLRYNSGREIAENGQELALLLETLASAWPVALDNIIVVGHSMGGLVARRALEYAAESGLAWPYRLGEIICLGSPHRGAALERLGEAANQTLTWTPYTRPFAAIGDVRSAGVKDLRYGVQWDDTLGPADVDIAYLLLAATLGSTDDDLLGRSIGDLLVAVASATDARSVEEPAPVTVRIFHRRSHFDLLFDDHVYIVIRHWLVQRLAARAPRKRDASTASDA